MTYKVYFQYRKVGDTTWGSTAKQDIYISEEFEEEISGLQPGTEYEYRAVLEVDGDVYYGEILSFTTKAYSNLGFEIIFGPVVFGAAHIEKRIRKATIVLSKDEQTTVYVATSASDIGDFTEDIPVGAGQELDMQEVRIPMAQGDPSGGLAYRVRVKGNGVVQVHDISFEVSARRI